MRRAGRIAIVGFIVAVPLAAVFAACGGSDSTVGGGSSSGACPPCVPPERPGCVGTGPCGCGPYICEGGAETAEESGLPTDSGSSRPNPQPPGTYMGFCLDQPDGGFACNAGLTCRLYGRVVTEAGATKSCQERICTQRCDAGCPAPATGCGATGYCDPEKCVP